jgi:ribosome-associated protein
MLPPRIRPEDVQFSAIRAQGPGGQNVNKVSNAAQLRFDIRASSLPEPLKARLLAWPDRRIGRDGVITITAQDSRSLPANRAAALARLQALVAAAAHVPRPRRPTAPTRASVERRLQAKERRAGVKALRRAAGD